MLTNEQKGPCDQVYFEYQDIKGFVENQPLKTHTATLREFNDKWLFDFKNGVIKDLKIIFVSE